MAVSTHKVIEIMGKDYAERFLETMYDQPVEDLVAEIMLRMDEKEIREILKQYQDEE
jgi:hypothetical protein